MTFLGKYGSPVFRSHLAEVVDTHPSADRASQVRTSEYRIVEVQPPCAFGFDVVEAAVAGAAGALRIEPVISRSRFSFVTLQSFPTDMKLLEALHWSRTALQHGRPPMPFFGSPRLSAPRICSPGLCCHKGCREGNSLDPAALSALLTFRRLNSLICLHLGTYAVGPPKKKACQRNFIRLGAD